MPVAIAGFAVPKLFCFGSSRTFDPATSRLLFCTLTRTEHLHRSRGTLLHGCVTPPEDVARVPIMREPRLQRRSLNRGHRTTPTNNPQKELTVELTIGWAVSLLPFKEVKEGLKQQAGRPA
jgi:hypothetical protein